MESDGVNKIMEILPTSGIWRNCNYKIIKTDFFENEDMFSTIVRININSKEGILKWFEEFQEKNHITLRVLRTYEEISRRNIFKKEYRCSHNTFPKKNAHAHPKHTGCKAKVTIILQNYKMKRSKAVHLKSHPCQVYIRHTHNHPLPKSRPPPKELEGVFQKLFEKGHSPSSALNVYKEKISNIDVDGEISGDGQKCPTQKWVHDLYYAIFKKEYGGPGVEMIASLQKIIDAYNETCQDSCAALNVEGNDLTVAVCSPLMKRVHERVQSSSEIIFVESAGNMDRHDSRIILLLCPSCVGAVPLGIILIYSEREESIIKGVSLLKTILPEWSFFNCGFPKFIITDDSTAERNALQKCFTHSKLLLCKFDVLQAVVRYLWIPKNGVKQSDRTYIYSLFNRALNSLNIPDFLEQYDQLLELECVSGHYKLRQYFNSLKSSSMNWAMCYRQDEITRGNQVNNYCEATFRILKDVIFPKTKAFSIVQLFDHLTAEFEQYYFKKIIGIINGGWESCKEKNKYHIDEKKLLDLECTFLESNLYQVKSKKFKGEYVVNSELECCSCLSGVTGAPCKHLVAVIETFNLDSQQYHPLVDSGSKQLFHYIATGNECKTTGWYDNIDGADIIAPTTETVVHEIICDINADIKTDLNQSTAETTVHENIRDIKEQLDNVFEMFKQKLENDPAEYEQPMRAFINNLNNHCQMESSLISALYSFGKYDSAAVPLREKSTRSGGCIAVQRVLETGIPAKKQRLSDHCYSKGDEKN